jgi:hypothetical protein
LADAGFDFAFAIGITDATRQCDRAVCHDISIERIKRRIVDVGRTHAFFEIVRDDERVPPAAERRVRATRRYLLALLPHERPARLPKCLSCVSGGSV